MPRSKKTINKSASRNVSTRGPRARRSRRAAAAAVLPTKEVAVAEIGPKLKPRLPNKVFLLLALVVILALALYKNKGLFLAATVNGQPILRFSLDAKLEQRYGSATLDEIINEQLIRDEAAKKGFKATPAEIDAKIADITKRFGNDKGLDDALAQQGMTRAELKKQVELQVLVEKMTAGSVNISDKDVSDYIDKNRSSLTATEEAGLRAEALNILTQQKKGEAFQKWFADLKAKAKVTKYL